MQFIEALNIPKRNFLFLFHILLKQVSQSIIKPTRALFLG